MASGNPPIRRLVLVAILLAAVVIGAALVWKRLMPSPVTQLPTSRPATQPTTLPTPAAASKPPKTFVDVVLRDDPHFPTTQPVPPVELPSAGHVLFHEPVCLDAMGNLWITRADAEPTEKVVKEARKQQVNVTREHVRFVCWQRDEGGNWVPALVCPNSKGDGFDLVMGKARKPIGNGKGYEWDRAFQLDGGRVGVPTDTGMSLFMLTLDIQGGNGPIPEYPSPPLAKAGEAHAPVEYAFYDGDPIIWMPPSAKHPGSSGAYRGVQTAWFHLAPDAGWPEGIVQLIPLNDGVLQLLSDGPQTVKLAMVPIQRREDQEEKITKLILTLWDANASKRDKAFEELTKYGPALWPIAERMMENSPPEAQVRLKVLLRNKISPLLGGMEIIGSRLRLLSRYPRGGALFYCDRGVSIPRGEETPRVVAPAWLSVVPGDRVRLVPPELTRDLSPDKHRLIPIDSGRWFVQDEVEGLRYYLEGVGFKPMLRHEELKYQQFEGIDAQGRYLFTDSKHDSTLVLDPSLPDANRRLPVWVMSYPEVGWDNENYPAMLFGAQEVSFRLRDWVKIDPDKGGKFFNRPEDVPKWPPMKAHPASRPTTGPSTRPKPPEDPIFVDREGNYYFDGKEALHVIHPDGSEVTWPLPGTATGQLHPWLVQTPDGRLFLYNQPGRMLKILPTPGESEPFRIEATFTRRVPNTQTVLRMWVDPLGRICMAYEHTYLAIFFPKGYVPAETRDVISGPDLDEMLRDE